MQRESTIGQDASPNISGRGPLAVFAADVRRAICSAPRLQRGMLATLLLLGIALRAAHLNRTMRYDESFSFLRYVQNGYLYSLTVYNEPNNHILNTLLMRLSD